LTQAGDDKWVLIAKFIALSAWWHTPLLQRWRGRATGTELELSAFPRMEPLETVAPDEEREMSDVASSCPTSNREMAASAGALSPHHCCPHAVVGNNLCRYGCRGPGGMAAAREEIAREAAAFQEAEAQKAEATKAPAARGGVSGAEAVAAVRASAMASRKGAAELAPLLPPDITKPDVSGDKANENATLESAAAKRRDELRQCFAPGEADLDIAKKALEAEFAICCTGRQFGEGLMNRPDVFRFLGDLQPTDVCGRDAATGLFGEDVVAKGLARSRVGILYDAVLELQVGLTSFEGRALSKGLTFDSFRVALHKAAIGIGLNFRYLADDAVEAFAEAAVAASKAQAPLPWKNAVTSRKPPGVTPCQ